MRNQLSTIRCLRGRTLFVMMQLFALLAISAEQPKLSLTPEEPAQSFNAVSGTVYTICSSQISGFNLASIFHELSINVVAPNDYKFPWHSVKGLSTDDFHSNTESFVLSMMGTEEEKAKKISPVVEFPQSFVRDIVSACPSPVFHSVRSTCSMGFSPFGEACVQLRTDASVRITATSEKKFNIWLPVNMLCGLGLIYLSQPLSKSSLFQYSSGALLFITGGLLVVSYFVSRRVILGTGQNRSSSSLRGMTALLTGSYGATIVWFLRSYLRTIFFKYAEFALAYIAIMACAGLKFVNYIRNMEGTKNLLRKSVKWLLRVSGTVFIWKSTASPMLSLSALGVLFVLYLVYKSTKRFAGSAGKGKKTD